MARLRKVALWLATTALVTPPGPLAAQQPPAGAPASGAAVPVNVWAFCTDRANNLLIQDLPSFTSAPAGSVVGQSACVQFAAPCPSDSARTRRRYSLRNSRERNSEWRLDLGDPAFANGGMSLPLTANIVSEKGTVQVVSSPGPWSVNLTRIPAAELRAGEGKKWKVDLVLEKAEPGAGCWVEVQCPARAQ